MSKNYFLSVLFSLFFFVGFSQRTELRGKIRAYSDELEGVNITNLSSNLTVMSGNGGYFKIHVQENDTIQFSAVHLKRKKIVISSSDMKSELLFVDMELANYDLKEVKINEFKNINAVDLGILSKPAKKYTPAERRLYTATGSANTYGLNTQVSFDAILNSFSGRTSMLKKEVKVEKKEYTIKKLNEWFDDQFYVEKFNIPPDYVKGFQFYLAENVHLEKAVKSKNKNLTIYIIGELSASYLEAIGEKK